MIKYSFTTTMYIEIQSELHEMMRTRPKYGTDYFKEELIAARNILSISQFPQSQGTLTESQFVSAIKYLKRAKSLAPLGHNFKFKIDSIIARLNQQPYRMY